MDLDDLGNIMGFMQTPRTKTKKRNEEETFLLSGCNESLILPSKLVRSWGSNRLLLPIGPTR
ncbi:hypothetical protein BLOT_014097 [Blomia tropicalis]|nr:hypothetical protein BLOT_014097 [Blomia tropicalis]